MDLPKYSSYEQIFKGYVRDLSAAREDALIWWEQLKTTAGSLPATDPVEALVRSRWPAGPVSYPRVLAVCRHYYLATVEFNESAVLTAQARDAGRSGGEFERSTVGEGFEVPPGYLLRNKLEDGYPELDDFIGLMPMYPSDSPLREYMGRPDLGALPGAFKFETIHRVDIGIERLMNCPADLPSTGAIRCDPPLPHAKASSAYQDLFLEYHRDLEVALSESEIWWAGVILRTSSGFFSRKRTAVHAAYDRFSAGPGGHPVLLGVIHKYWMKCVVLNESLGEAQGIPPEVLLLHWLADGEHSSWVECLTCMPYWPIGLDESQLWV